MEIHGSWEMGEERLLQMTFEQIGIAYSEF